MTKQAWHCRALVLINLTLGCNNMMTVNSKKQCLETTTRYHGLLGSKIKKLGLLLALNTVLTMTCQATERDSGFYAGFGVANIMAEEQGISSRENGMSLLGGYSYSKYLSGEVSLFNLGDHNALGMKGKGVSLSAIGSYPVLKNLDLFVELGGMSIDIEIDEAQNLITAPNGEGSLQDGRDSSIYYAIGAKYKLKDWSFVLKTARVDLDADMDIIFAQVHYHF